MHPRKHGDRRGRKVVWGILQANSMQGKPRTRDILIARRLAVGLEEGVIGVVITLAAIVETVIIITIHCSTIIPSRSISIFIVVIVYSFSC